jgi:hypothetical protein
MVHITNEPGEWAKVPGEVWKQRMARPGDPDGRVQDWDFIEIGQYWEWRHFNNQERWTVKVDYGNLTFEFAVGGGVNGDIYHIQGVYGLPETRYAQVATVDDMVRGNGAIGAAIRDYSRTMVANMAANPDKPPQLGQMAYTGGGVKLAPMSAENREDIRSNSVPVSSDSDIPKPAPMLSDSGVTAAPMLFFTILLITTIIVSVVSIVALVSNTNSRRPGWTEKDQEAYDAIKPDLTEEQRQHLELYKEFSMDFDAPSSQQIVMLNLLDGDGKHVPIFDENGLRVFVHRGTYAIGNQHFAVLNRYRWALVRYFPDTQQLADMHGDRITTNDRNRLVNADGVELFSPRSAEDCRIKLEAMSKYTSRYDYRHLMYSMADGGQLSMAMARDNNDPYLGLFGTIGNAFRNLFGNGNSNGRKLGFLDILVVLAVLAVAIIIAVVVYKICRGLLRKRTGV